MMVVTCGNGFVDDHDTGGNGRWWCAFLPVIVLRIMQQPSSRLLSGCALATIRSQ